MLETDPASSNHERGDGPVGLLIGASVFLLGAVLLVYMALGYHAAQVLDVAAQEGAVLGAGYGASAELGSNHADQLIAESASSLLESWTIESEIEVDTNGRARLVVLIEAKIAGPIGPWPVTGSGSAPIEDFVPQVDRFRSESGGTNP